MSDKEEIETVEESHELDDHDEQLLESSDDFQENYVEAAENGGEEHEKLTEDIAEEGIEQILDEHGEGNEEEHKDDEEHDDDEHKDDEQNNDEDEDEEENQDLEEQDDDKDQAQKFKRVFVYPVCPSDLSDPKLKKFTKKAAVVNSRFMGVRGGNKRGHLLMWFKTAQLATRVAEEMKGLCLSDRAEPLKIVVSNGLTVPMCEIMDEWNKVISNNEESLSQTRTVLVKNLAPKTPVALLQVLFPVALNIEMSNVDEENENQSRVATLTFENKTDAATSIYNAKGIRIQDYELNLELVLTEEELLEKEEKQKQKDEREKAKEGEKDTEKGEDDEKDSEEKKDDEEAQEDEDERRKSRRSERRSGSRDDRYDRPKRKSSPRRHENRKRGRYQGMSHDRDRSRSNRDSWRRGGWGSGGGFNDGGLMGLLNTLQQVQRMQHQQNRGYHGRRW